MNLAKLAAQGPPAPLQFPSFCNPHALEVWLKVARDLPKDPRSAWQLVLRLYAQGCRDAGLLPFVRQSVVDIDQACRTFLKNRRFTLQRFANRSKLLADVKLWNKEILVSRSALGFVLEVRLHAEIPDPTWYERLFRIPLYKFSRMRHGYEWRCQVDPATQVFVSTHNRNVARAWIIGYRISCPLLIDPGVTKFDEYVLKKLWRPVTGMRPFPGDKIRRL